MPRINISPRIKSFTNREPGAPGPPLFPGCPYNNLEISSFSRNYSNKTYGLSWGSKVSWIMVCFELRMIYPGLPGLPNPQVPLFPASPAEN